MCSFCLQQASGAVLYSSISLQAARCTLLAAFQG